MARQSTISGMAVIESSMTLRIVLGSRYLDSFRVMRRASMIWVSATAASGAFCNGRFFLICIGLVRVQGVPSKSAGTTVRVISASFEPPCQLVLFVPHLRREQGRVLSMILFASAAG